MPLFATRCFRALVSIQGGERYSHLGKRLGKYLAASRRGGQAMNTKLVEAIANVVLYEGYMLYPYRPSSVKNRQRFNFGVLYPPSYSEAQAGSDACSMQTECLAEGSGLTA